MMRVSNDSSVKRMNLPAKMIDENAGNYSNRERSFSDCSTDCDDEMENPILSHVPMTEERDQYGQRHPIECPELIEWKLKEFDEEVKKIPLCDKKCLLGAEERCPELLTPAFKLMFLRTDVFRADDAAQRYAKYWTKRVDVFGPEVAYKRLTLKSCLKDEDYKLWPSAHVMRVGGRVTRFTQTRVLDDMEDYTYESLARVTWYQLHAVLDDEDVQKRGAVILIDFSNSRGSKKTREHHLKLLRSIDKSIPLRFSCAHLVFAPRWFSAVWSMVKWALSKHQTQRVRIHCGDYDKVMSRLKQFGITREELPKEMGGDLILDSDAWLKGRRLLEEDHN